MVVSAEENDHYFQTKDACDLQSLNDGILGGYSLMWQSHGAWAGPPPPPPFFLGIEHQKFLCGECIEN